MTKETQLKDIGAHDVRAAADGDAAALEALVRALRRPAYALALRMTGHHDDAQDASQEAILRVVTRLSTFRSASKFSTWAWTVMTRSVIDGLRKSNVEVLSFDDFAQDLERSADLSAEPTAEDRVLLRQVKIGCARALLGCLDLDARAAYVLGEILEVDAPTCAHALEISPATFRKRLSRARSSLQTALRRQCGVVEPSASCRCAKRIAPAKALGRLDARDKAPGDESVAQLGELISKLDVLSRAAAYYHADPRSPGAFDLVERVLDLCATADVQA